MAEPAVLLPIIPAPLVIEAVAAQFMIAVVDLRGQRITKSLGFARQVTVALLDELTVMSDAEIAVALGRTTGTACSLLRAVKKRLAQDQRFAASVEQCRKRLLQVDHG